MMMYDEPILLKKVKKKKIVFHLIAIIVFFILLFIYSLVNIIMYFHQNKQTSDIIQKVSDVADLKELKIEDDVGTDNKETPEYDIDYQNLRQVNNDFFGYLIVHGTNISQSVVKGKDNDYYLHHNFYKQYDVAGWLFADYENENISTDKNVIIYGHNMKTGTMFGTLKNILTKEWYNNSNNKYITYITDEGVNKYEVFSIYIVENEDYYRTVKFNDDEFAKFIQTIKRRSIHDFDVDVSSADYVLTLSTCHTNNKYRVVLHAKRV